MRGHFLEEWRRCAVCDFWHPISMLSMQKGVLKCKCHQCWDDLSNQYRQQQIQEVLKDTSEGISEVSEKTQDPGEIIQF